jgi:hypothetical protein
MGFVFQIERAQECLRQAGSVRGGRPEKVRRAAVVITTVP